MSINPKSSLAIIIALNLLPIWGVLEWGWTPFMVFYLFWIETLIIAVFNALKIFFCRGDEYESRLEISNHSLAGIHVKYSSHFGKALSYLTIRIFVFFFYLIFIIVFIGFVMSKDSNDHQVFETVFFFNKTFNYTLLGFILNQAGLFIFNFILNDEFKRTHPSDFAAIFDGRQVIIHVAVVVAGVFGGFFGNTISNDKKFNQMAVYLFAISVFCIVKIIYEVIKYKGIKLKMDERSEVENKKSPALG